MNDEIKKILDNLRKVADNRVFVVYSTQEELDRIPKYTANFLSVNDRQAKILLDYIDNLQQRIYKARKMIFDNYGLLDKYEIEMLDDILKGDSNE